MIHDKNMIAFNKEFRSDNIILRPLLKEDFQEMYQLTKDPQMWTYFTSDLSDKDELKNWIDSAIKDYSRLALTIIDQKTKRIIGSTSIGNISSSDKRAEIGWSWIGKDYQGKGYNALVKGLMLRYLFDDCDFERVEFKTDVLNIPARKALKKMGLVEEGILRSHTLMIRNRRRDTIFYGVLKKEWEKMRSQNRWY